MEKNKIKQYSLFKAKTLLQQPIADATHTLTEISFLVLRIQLYSGVIGESYLLSFQYSPGAIAGALRDVGEMLLDEEVQDTVHCFQRVDAANEYFGQEGVNRWVQAAYNIAMWDAWGKTLGQPIWKLLGTAARKVPVYGSGGWLSYSPEMLLEEVKGYQVRGFKAVKIKVGKPAWREDVERLTLVREALGPEMRIMMDANQGLSLADALRLAEEARKIHIHWFEEPIDHKNYEGYRQLKAQSGISIAMGEREYNTLPLRDLLTRGALDIWQPDILRIGGVEAWRESAALANAFQVPVLPHYYKDYDVPLLCTIPNAAGAESFDWIDPLIDHPLAIVDGHALPHGRPGWGFMFKDEVLEEI